MAKKASEHAIYGLNACLAASKHRPEAIIRAYITQKNLPFFKEALQFLAANKRAYHIVTDKDLERMTSSTHHEGVSFLLREVSPPSLDEILRSTRDCSLFVGLIGVSNPHNIGAIARSAAHFGVTGLILSENGPAALSGSTFRVAQGGMEFLPQITVPLRQLGALKKKGIKFIAPSPHRGTALHNFRFPKHSLLLFGEEGEGLPLPVEKSADFVVTIPGTGSVESLNVSNAATLFFQQWWLQSQKSGAVSGKK